MCPLYRRYKMPLYIVRSKSDIDINNIMQDLRHKKRRWHRWQCRRLSNKSSTIANRQHQEQISAGEILVTSKGYKTATAIGEARLMETILKSEHARRYSNQAVGTENHLLTNSYSLALIDLLFALTGSLTNEWSTWMQQIEMTPFFDSTWIQAFWFLIDCITVLSCLM